MELAKLAEQQSARVAAGKPAIRMQGRIVGWDDDGHVHINVGLSTLARCDQVTKAALKSRGINDSAHFQVEHVLAMAEELVIRIVSNEDTYTDEDMKVTCCEADCSPRDGEHPKDGEKMDYVKEMLGKGPAPVDPRTAIMDMTAHQMQLDAANYADRLMRFRGSREFTLNRDKDKGISNLWEGEADEKAALANMLRRKLVSEIGINDRSFLRQVLDITISDRGVYSAIREHLVRLDNDWERLHAKRTEDMTRLGKPLAESVGGCVPTPLQGSPLKSSRLTPILQNPQLTVCVSMSTHITRGYHNFTFRGGIPTQKVTDGNFAVFLETAGEWRGRSRDPMTRGGNVNAMVCVTRINDAVGSGTVLRTIMGAYSLMVTHNASRDLEITLAIEPTMDRNLNVRQQPREHSVLFWAVLNDRHVPEDTHLDQREPKIFYETVEQEVRVSSIPPTSYVARWNDSHREAMIEIGDRVMFIPQ